MNCPRCQSPADPSGVVTVDDAQLIVYQCDRCRVPWQVGESTFETALTFAVSEDGRYIDPDSGVVLSLN